MYNDETDDTNDMYFDSEGTEQWKPGSPQAISWQKAYEANYRAVQAELAAKKADRAE
jgi:hypothetical protein